MLTAIRDARCALTQLLLALALLAAGAQAAFGAGVMLDRGEDGRLGVVLCTADGALQVHLDPQTGDWVPVQAGAGADGPNITCHLAALASAALPGDPAGSTPRRLPRETAQTAAAPLAAPARTAVPPPARGPPAFP